MPPPDVDRFELTPNPFETIVTAHAGPILAAAVRALIDGGAIRLPSGVDPDAIQVTADPGDPGRLTLTVGDHSRAFPVDVRGDDALTELATLLGREADRVVMHLNEVLHDLQTGHLQW
jgi:hypothetical protein